MRVADRMDSDDLRWTVTALGIQREVGGNLSNILETAAQTDQGSRANSVVRCARCRPRAGCRAGCSPRFPSVCSSTCWWPTAPTSRSSGPTPGFVLLGAWSVIIILGFFWMRGSSRSRCDERTPDPHPGFGLRVHADRHRGAGDPVDREAATSGAHSRMVSWLRIGRARRPSQGGEHKSVFRAAWSRLGARLVHGNRDALERQSGAGRRPEPEGRRDSSSAR